jgi:hypothetical protein
MDLTYALQITDDAPQLLSRVDLFCAVQQRRSNQRNMDALYFMAEEAA